MVLSLKEVLKSRHTRVICYDRTCISASLAPFWRLNLVHFTCLQNSSWFFSLFVLAWCLPVLTIGSMIQGKVAPSSKSCFALSQTTAFLKKRKIRKWHVLRWGMSSPPLGLVIKHAFSLALGGWNSTQFWKARWQTVIRDLPSSVWSSALSVSFFQQDD